MVMGLRFIGVSPNQEGKWLVVLATTSSTFVEPSHHPVEIECEELLRRRLRCPNKTPLGSIRVPCEERCVKSINPSLSVSTHPIKLRPPCFLESEKFRTSLIFFDLFRLLWRYHKMTYAAVNYAADKSRIH
jgi:hypothetical protein